MTQRTSAKLYYLRTVEIKDYNVLINGENGCLLNYQYIKDYYKMIAADLSKQQVLDPDPRAIQQINFTGNLDRAGNTRIYFILEEAKETILYFSQ